MEEDEEEEEAEEEDEAEAEAEDKEEAEAEEDRERGTVMLKMQGKNNTCMFVYNMQETWNSNCTSWSQKYCVWEHIILIFFTS